MATELPDVNSPNVHLVIATPEEHKEEWYLNSAEWLGPLSMEGYIRREEYLLSQDLTKDTGLTPWLLVHEPKNGTKRKILSACETFNKRALVAENGRVEDVVCHGVGSVFCEGENRGRGYAQRMMADLAERLKQWQKKDQKVLFSVLFSDIGKKFYSKIGWQSFPSSHVALTASSEPHQQADVKLLTNDFEDLCSIDEKHLRQQFTSLSQKSSKKLVTVIPDARTIKWHFARGDFFVKELFGKQIVNRGALIQLGDGRRAWCYWQHNFYSTEDYHKDNKLYILRLVVEGDDDLEAATEDGVKRVLEERPDTVKAVAALFAAARKEADEWKLARVDCWNPSSLTLAAARAVQADAPMVAREQSSITSLQWYGEGQSRDLRWMCNERFAWC